MPEEKKSILSIGAVMVDLVCQVAALPKSGEGAVASEHTASVGGCAFNQANVMRQMGEACFLFAPVGRGVYAEFTQRELDARGMEALRVDADIDCGACLCLIEPDGERTMITMPGIEQHFNAAWFDSVDAGSFAWGIANGYEIEGAGGDAILSFFEQHRNIQFVYAPGPRINAVSAKKNARINALRPLWHLNDLEALSFTGAATLQGAGEAIAKQCGNIVVITQGACGSHLFSQTERLFEPAIAVDAVDTVGAGDAHVGTLVAARHAGCSWSEALSVANRVSSALCGISGATFSDEQFAAIRPTLPLPGRN